MLVSSSKNPFKILGVSPTSSFETIQKRFTELSLKYHPDTASHSRQAQAAETTTQQSHKKKNVDASHFIRIRQAFEYIRKTRFNATTQKKGANSSNNHFSSSFEQQQQYHHHRFSERNFLNYFYEQTGVRLTSSQRREMIELYRNRTPGYYGGHSWDIARRLSFEQDSYLARMQEYQQHDDLHSDLNDDASSSSSGNNGDEEDNSQNRSNDGSSDNNNKLRRRKRRR
jgi:DnaJ-class molecular chaperone